MLGRECVQSDEELLSLGCVLAADDLVQTVDEDTGDIVVAGMQTADKAEQACDVANRIIRCVDQTRVMRDIESQLVAAGISSLVLPEPVPPIISFTIVFILPTFEVAISVP